MSKSACYLLLLIQLFSLCRSVPVSSLTNPNAVSQPDTPEIQRGLYQGDMLLQPSTTGRGVAILPIQIHRWPNGVLPYEFASNVSVNNTLFIERMMREMENLTAVNGVQCITFRPKNASDTAFLTIHNGSGCSAPVGRWPGWNGLRPVSLMHSPTSTCMISGTIQHELMHALGFYHEQSRPDRDTYVNIRWSNINPNSAFNFDKYNDSEVDTQSTPYDYGSVMHYGAYSFAINNSAPTIIAVFNSSAALGQRIRLSPIDILEIQRGYGCVATPTTTTTTTTTSALGANATTLTTTTSTTSATTSRTTTTTTTTTSTSTSSSTSVTTTSATTVTTTSATTVTTTSATTVTTTSVTTITTTNRATSLYQPFWVDFVLLVFGLFFNPIKF